MSWNVFEKLSDLIKDAHVPIAIAVFTVTSFMHFWTRADLGPQYVNSLYALYAFLGGHAFVNRGNNSESPVPPALPKQ